VSTIRDLLQIRNAGYDRKREAGIDNSSPATDCGQFDRSSKSAFVSGVPDWDLQVLRLKHSSDGKSGCWI
jgi:hypothetical protein